MDCPHCNHLQSTVLETRSYEGGVRRRRKCLSPKCGERFSTVEVVVADRQQINPKKLVLINRGVIV